MAKNYSIIEDLYQAPCAMLGIRIPPKNPLKWKELLNVTEGVDLSNSNVIGFPLDQYSPGLPSQVASHIHVKS